MGCKTEQELECLLHYSFPYIFISKSMEGHNVMLFAIFDRFMSYNHLLKTFVWSAYINVYNCCESVYYQLGDEIDILEY